MLIHVPDLPLHVLGSIRVGVLDWPVGIKPLANLSECPPGGGRLAFRSAWLPSTNEEGRSREAVPVSFGDYSDVSVPASTGILAGIELGPLPAILPQCSRGAPAPSEGTGNFAGKAGPSGRAEPVGTHDDRIRKEEPDAFRLPCARGRARGAAFGSSPRGGGRGAQSLREAAQVLADAVGPLLDPSPQDTDR